MEGLLLIDKSKDISSFGVVAKIRGIIRVKTGQKLKIGHSGTLDPQATGLLVLAIGNRYTKKLTQLTLLPKTYEVTMRLGQTSSTGDVEGEITNSSEHQPTKTEIGQVLRQFRGNIMQIPPAFSAIKINGQRAYKLARQGRTIELKARPVKVISNKLTLYTYPFVYFATDVSSGTYIRVLVEDIGRTLGVGAYTKELRRTKIGHFNVDKAVQLEKLSYSDIVQHLFTLDK